MRVLDMLALAGCRLARVAEALGVRLRLTGALGPDNAQVRPPADAAATEAAAEPGEGG